MKMEFENISGNLKDAYAQIKPSTMRHIDELTTERRTNHELRGMNFYTADGNLYTDKKELLWGITREPQNLFLRHIDEAYPQLTQRGNYFPALQEAQASFEHSDTVVVDVKGLKLVKDNGEYGHFVVDPENVKNLNSQQKLAAQRIYGHDEDNFRQNLEIFAEAEKQPWVFVLMPEYVQHTLRENGKEYLARASWLTFFVIDSIFYADVRSIGGHFRVRGVRRGASVSEQEAPSGARAENQVSPSLEQHIVHLLTRDKILDIARPLVAVPLWQDFTKIIPKQAPVSGDVLQRAADGQYFSPHSWKEFKTKLGKYILK